MVNNLKEPDDGFVIWVLSLLTPRIMERLQYMSPFISHRIATSLLSKSRFDDDQETRYRKNLLEANMYQVFQYSQKYKSGWTIPKMSPRRSVECSRNLDQIKRSSRTWRSWSGVILIMWRIFWWSRLPPSVNEADGEEDGWAMVRKFWEKTQWMRVETNCGVGKDIQYQQQVPVNGNKSTSHRNAQGSNTAVNALILRVPVHHRSSLISKMYSFQNLKGWRTTRNDFKIVLPSASASSSSTIPSLGLRLIQSPHCSFLPFCLPYHLLLIRSRTVQQ